MNRITAGRMASSARPTISCMNDRWPTSRPRDLIAIKSPGEPSWRPESNFEPEFPKTLRRRRQNRGIDQI